MSKRVLLVGLDGLRTDALLYAHAPNLRSFIERGAYSFYAQTERITMSAPCWASILSGVSIDHHGVIDNTFAGFRWQENPSLFHLQANGERVRSYACSSWSGISLIALSGADTIIEHAGGSLQPLVDTTQLLQSAECPPIVFVYSDHIDHAGHKHGFALHAAEYIRAIEQTDALLGELLSALQQRNENWLVLVTTDHGGIDRQSTSAAYQANFDAVNDQVRICESLSLFVFRLLVCRSSGANAIVVDCTVKIFQTIVQSSSLPGLNLNCSFVRLFVCSIAFTVGTVCSVERLFLRLVVLILQLQHLHICMALQSHRLMVFLSQSQNCHKTSQRMPRTSSRASRIALMNSSPQSSCLVACTSLQSSKNR
jgi:hypothetical protein